MNFGQALEVIKAGGAVAREGWNGKNMWIYLSPSHPAVEDCIVMKTAQGKVQPGWLASQPDMLAEDWVKVS